MHLHRFFVASEWLQRDPITLGGEVSHQLSRVLRLKPGDEIELLDNSGAAWRAQLVEVSPRQCLAARLRLYYPDTEPPVPLILYQGLPSGRKLDLVLQKSTELGATKIVPVPASRSVQGERPEAGGARLKRWRRIVQEAAEQSGRARMPEVSDVVKLDRAIQDIGTGDLCLVGALDEGAVGIRDVLEGCKSPASVRLFVGPEGGFDDDELALLRSARVISVSLGSRVLRTETAGLAMLAVVAYALGEMSTKGADASP